MKFRISLLGAAFATVAMAAFLPRAQAAWTKIEDFEAYSINQNVTAHHGWLASTGTFPIVADPANSANKVLSVSNAAFRIFV